MPQALQRVGCHPVAGGCRIVVPGLRAVDERLVIVGSEKEAAGCLVLEPLEQSIRQRDGKGEIVGAELRLHQLEQGREQEGVVVEIGIEAGMPESFNVLIKEIRSLGLDIELEKN